MTITVFAIGPLNIFVHFVKPSQAFAEEERVPAPDYSDLHFWAAHPDKEDFSDRRPKNTTPDTSLASLDVFYIHPTGFLKGSHWNSRLETESATEENTSWMMANQASVFSDARVYAPRYREATIYSFVNPEGIDESSALQLAYEDVVSAFEYYLAHYNQDRPFVLASHSQGSYHGFTLIKRMLDKSPIRERMIAAYLIGMGTITEEAVAELQNIEVCDSPDQTGCLIHWATFEELSDRPEGWGKTMICVNPLTWRRNGGMENKNAHKGFVPSAGTYNLSMTGSDDPKGMIINELTAPKVNHTRATCNEGRLLVERQDVPNTILGKGNYHGIDYQLFHMDIRQNLSERFRSYNAIGEQVAAKGAL